MGDAGDELTFHLRFLELGFQVSVAHDQRAGKVILGGFIEGRKHLHDHAFLHGEADRACLQHLGADRGQFEHLFIGDEVELAGACNDARIGGIDAVNVGVDVAAVGLDRRRHGDRRRVGSAASQRGHPAIVHHALKTRDDRDLPRLHRGNQRVGFNR